MLSIDPMFAEIWGIKLWYHGLAYAIGFALMFLWIMLRRRSLGLSYRQVLDLSILIQLFSLIAGRLFEIFVYEWEAFRSDYHELYALWHGGMAIEGAIIGIFLACGFFCLIYRKRFLVIADEIVFPLAFLLVLIRIGNHLNGELYGYVTSAWWAVKFPHADGFRHPVALYDAFKYFLVVFVLMIVSRQALPGQGRLLGHFLFWSGLMTVGVDLFQKPGLLTWQIGTEQFINVLVAAVGLLLIVRSSVKHRKKKTDLHTLEFSPPSFIARIPSGYSATAFRIILFTFLLLFCMTIPCSTSRLSSRHVASSETHISGNSRVLCHPFPVSDNVHFSTLQG